MAAHKPHKYNMILSFKTHFDSKHTKPTLFTNKIVKGLWVECPQLMPLIPKSEIPTDRYVFEPLTDKEYESLKPKVHTIRLDKNRRWKAGKMIDFAIYPRSKKFYKFAPSLECVSIQTIEIMYHDPGDPVVYIDGQVFYCSGLDDAGMLELANNDGFDTVEDFFKYFNESMVGVLIHWTEKRYYSPITDPEPQLNADI